ncbi:MAG: dUTPase [Candidatus Nitrosocaldus sp.]|nr:dUTPase [Candidatus Nitrosocaldus sp.]MCS7141714.1 dUTPase [Candidatus Nitrosocaldus sp.]MDW8000732.1 dUTPase [Candidatus Nitrosocaldus sp.]MDW8276369.1 dUTPase [Candidatus Nitrosocaldus sp.]
MCTDGQDTDTLQAIFRMQREYMDMMDGARMGKSREERISQLCTAIIHEACELQDLANWKWWKSPSRFDEEKAKEELIDILHFVIQISIELGMDARDILDAYARKNAINRERQLRGY